MDKSILDVIQESAKELHQVGTMSDANLREFEALRPASAVCFDAFGTLIRYHGQPINPYRHLLQGAQNVQSLRLALLTRNVNIDTFANELGIPQLLPSIHAELTQELSGLSLFPEVPALLRQLRAAGKQIAVCSNLAFEYGSAVKRLLPDLDAYILSYEVGAAKPEHTIFQTVCDALGCAPQEVLFVGDSKRCDLDGPLSFGMQAHWLDRKNGQTLADALPI